MMGHRAKLSGNEVDALTRARRHYGPTAGVVAWFKRKFNKRQRLIARKELARQ